MAAAAAEGRIGGVATWAAALVKSRAFLGRWGDPFTRMERDDLAQEAVLALWLYMRGRQRPCRPTALYTITRRTRLRAFWQLTRDGQACIERAGIGSDGADPPPRQHLRVAGMLVPRDWLVTRLAMLLARLGATNRRIVVAYYEGFSCGELAARMGLSEEVVKVRLYRSRLRIRNRLEALTRAAGHFER